MTTQTAPTIEEIRARINQPGVSLVEDEVLLLVEAARNDCTENLMSPIWAYVNSAAVNRHHRRFMKVTGVINNAKSWLKSTGMGW